MPKQMCQVNQIKHCGVELDQEGEGSRSRVQGSGSDRLVFLQQGEVPGTKPPVAHMGPSNELPTRPGVDLPAPLEKR